MLTPIALLADLEFDCFALSWTKLAPSLLLKTEKDGRVGMLCLQTFGRSLIFGRMPSFLRRQIQRSSPGSQPTNFARDPLLPTRT